MTIVDYAIRVLAMHPTKRGVAIRNLEFGLKKEPKWNKKHKEEVKLLIKFLKSDSTNLDDLISYIPSN